MNLEGDASEPVLLRFGDGSSVVEGEGMDGEELAALCMNFMVNSLEDMDFGILPGVLVADISVVCQRLNRIGFFRSPAKFVILF